MPRIVKCPYAVVETVVVVVVVVVVVGGGGGGGGVSVVDLCHTGVKAMHGAAFEVTGNLVGMTSMKVLQAALMNLCLQPFSLFCRCVWLMYC